MNNIEALIKNFPSVPGVYLYQDKSGKVIYIGKAKNLKKRVSSYFNKQQLDPKTKLLVSKINNISSIVTNSEAEALLLEDSLIKKYKPKYNIDLKDDKRFPYFCLDLTQQYPRLNIVRQRKKDKAKYFGPYAGSITDTLKVIEKVFRLRKCKNINKKGCLYLQLGQCLGPCQSNDQQAYNSEVKGLISFLSGNFQALLEQIKSEMNKASQNEEYEKAAVLRDKLEYLTKVSEKQTVVAPDLAKRDIWNFANNDKYFVAQVLMMQNGRITGSKSFSMINDQNIDGDFPERTILNFYQTEGVPQEIIAPPELELAALKEWLENNNTKLLQPGQGFRAGLLKLARKNVLKIIQDKMLASLKENKSLVQLKALQSILGLDVLPARIECFDISNIQGHDTVAAMTVFANGFPDKNQYRRFHLEQEAPNDFAAMEQVLNRRYYKVMTGEAVSPALIVIDGGKGQLNIAAQVLKKYQLKIPVIGLAKKNEEIFLPGRMNPLTLKRSSPALKLIQSIRDEAHRFAINFHRQKRSKRFFSSSLDKIPGLGPKGREKLIKKYKTIETIKEQTLEELSKVINRKQAKAVVKYFTAGETN